MDSGFKHMDFEPKEYMNTYYSGTAGAFSDDKYLKFMLANLHKTFSSGEVKGDLLIDIGAGPTIYQIISACECFTEIVATDLLEQNHQEIKRWLENKPGAFDWTLAGKMVCEMEGDRGKWPEKEKKIRATVKQVIKCDVLESKPLEPITLPQADCLLSLLCLEAACQDMASFDRALKNISSLLKIGGHLVLGGVLGCVAWMSGEKEFPSLCLDEDLLRNSLAKNGYVVRELELEPVSGKCNKSICIYDANFFIVAQKLKAV
ncbi:nicotinamide N-methyltransferase-like isoform X2 [Lissotriton helveticus]